MSDSNQFKLGDALRSFLKSNGLEEKFILAEIKAHWKDWVGNKIDDNTNDLYLKKGVLTVYLGSGVLKAALAMRREDLKNHINKKLGEKAIIRIELR
jgi:predicted nucleic acid-binding Zn ribbon protein